MAIIVLAVVFYYYNKPPRAVNNNNQTNNPVAATGNETPAPAVKTPAPEVTTPAPETATTTPKKATSLNLPIPFTSQAPTANWDELHNEACEEASAIMANAYLTDDRDKVIPAVRVEKEISALTDWQVKNFGYNLNTTAEETAKMIEGYYGLKAKVVSDYTLQDIKDQLDLDHVVILPVNGRLIGNPNYKQPGPIYHMLVIRGYTVGNLITNDSGTRKGQNYIYTYKTLSASAADWDHATDTIDQSKKVMIIVSK